MPNMTIRIPEDLKSALDVHLEINWIEFPRQSREEYIHTLKLADSIVAKSDLTETEAKKFSEDVKADIVKHFEE